MQPYESPPPYAGASLVLSTVGDAVASPGSETSLVDDGLLSARKICLGWRLDADVVTLSGCQTGNGRWASGEYLGFLQALLRAGARSVVLSLWKVDDAATALRMSRFYEILGACPRRAPGLATTAPCSKAEALRRAKIWLRDFEDEPGHHPFARPAYWAGFVLIGDPS